MTTPGSNKSGLQQGEGFSTPQGLAETNRRLQDEVQRLQQQVRKLEDSEAEYRMLFDQAAAGFARFNLSGYFVDANSRLCQMFGRTQEELRRLRWTDVTHPSDLPGNTDGLKKMMSGEISTYGTVKRYLRKDGTPFWAQLTVSLLRASDGSPRYFIAIIQDLSEQKQAQERLARRTQQLQSILDYTTAVIYIKEPDGRYELVNRRFEEIFHLAARDIIGRTDFEIFPAEWAQNFRTNDVYVLQSGQAMELEECVPQDGEVHTYISVKFPVRDATGNPIALGGVSTDITQRKKDEAEIIRAKDAAEQASQAKSRFLANISHEVRTPIMAILAAAELIRSRAATDPEVGEHGEVVWRNGRHLLALVDELLDQSMMDADRMRVLRTSCCLPEIIADVQAIARPLLRGKLVDFQILIENTIPEIITTDRTRLTQAVVNLVHNAIKFTESGHLHVRVRFDQVERSPFLTIAVEDTGVGIAASDVNRIFEPFVQVSPGSRNASAGVGLGLSVAKWIATRLGGSLRVQSQPDSGSTFTITIPVGPIETEKWIAPNDAHLWSSKSIKDLLTLNLRLHGDVLLAEDAPDVRHLMSLALERTGAKVVAVEDGERAVDAALRQPFDLILLDIRMPGMSGTDAAQAIRKQGYTGPLIALTASTARTDQDRILGAGFDELWWKPISLGVFLERSSAYLQSSPGLSGRDASTTKALLQSAAQEFAAGLGVRIARLQALVESDDMRGAGEILHQLIGSSGIHGFMELSSVARAAYEACVAGSLRVASKPFQSLIASVTSVTSRRGDNS